MSFKVSSTQTVLWFFDSMNPWFYDFERWIGKRSLWGLWWMWSIKVWKNPQGHPGVATFHGNRGTLRQGAPASCLHTAWVPARPLKGPWARSTSWVQRDRSETWQRDFVEAWSPSRISVLFLQMRSECDQPVPSHSDGVIHKQCKHSFENRCHPFHS